MDSSKIELGTAESSIKQGHEPENVKVSILTKFAVLMVIGAVATWALCWQILQIGISKPPEEAKPNPRAKALNDQPLNERLTRIDTYSPKAEYKQPRLEFMKLRDYRKDADGNVEPPYLRPAAPSKEGNTPEYHPEDLRADRIPSLNEPKHEVKGEKGIVQIPITEAMDKAVKDHWLPTQKKPVNLNKVTPQDTPKLSNGGQVATPTQK